MVRPTPHVDLAQLSDGDLIGAARSLEPSAFAELWRRYYRPGMAAARAMSSFDADDLVAESFARIYVRIREGGGPTGEFLPYLYATIRNTAATWARTQREFSSDRLEDVADEEAPEPLDATDRDAIIGAFRSLRTRWQEALWFSEVEQLSQVEVGERLGIRANAVSALTFRAREGLRRAWLERVSYDHPRDHVRLLVAGGTESRLSDRDVRALERQYQECAECREIRAKSFGLSRTLSFALLPFMASATAAAAFHLMGAQAASMTALGAGVGAGSAGAGPAAGGGAATAGAGAAGSAATVGASLVIGALVIGAGAVVAVSLIGGLPTSVPVRAPLVPDSNTGTSVHPGPTASPSPSPSPSASPPSSPPSSLPADGDAHASSPLTVVIAPSGEVAVNVVEIRGVAEPGSIVTASTDTGLVGQATAAANSGWAISFDLSGVDDGAHSIRIESPGQPSFTAQFVLDRVAYAPGLTSLDSGSGRFYPAITGTAEPNAVVSIEVGTQHFDQVADGTGRWSVGPLTRVGFGDTPVVLRQTDSAGNVSPPRTAGPIRIVAPTVDFRRDGAYVTVTVAGPAGSSLWLAVHGADPSSGIRVDLGQGGVIQLPVWDVQILSGACVDARFTDGVSRSGPVATACVP